MSCYHPIYSYHFLLYAYTSLGRLTFKSVVSISMAIMPRQLLYISTLFLYLCLPIHPQPSGTRPILKLLLETPYTVEAEFGHPTEVIGTTLKNRITWVQWKYLNHTTAHPTKPGRIGSLYLRIDYAQGQVVSYYAAPQTGDNLPSSPRHYIPSDVIFKVREYDDEGKLIGTPDQPYVELYFYDKYIEGQLLIRSSPMKRQKLLPSGLYRTVYDLSQVWSARTLAVSLKLRDPYYHRMRTTGQLSEAAKKAITSLPLKQG